MTHTSTSHTHYDVIQKKTAFEIVVALYKDGKLEPNTGRRNWGDGPSGNILGAAGMTHYTMTNDTMTHI